MIINDSKKKRKNKESMDPVAIEQKLKEAEEKTKLWIKEGSVLFPDVPKESRNDYRNNIYASYTLYGVKRRIKRKRKLGVPRKNEKDLTNRK